MNFFLKLKSFLPVFLLCTFIPVASFSQQKRNDIKIMINNRQYIFIAQNVITLSGRNIVLSPDNELKVTPDSLIADLPYFGRAYQAPMDPEDAGINFTSVKFDYKTRKAGKNGWNVTINTKDLSENYHLSLHVSSNGFATLRATGIFRQMITFNGYLKENTFSKKAF
ncbi:MAG: DUF4251 domain-containing protein [Chitinophagales bacterium]|nr:DUF4251 domain-containing protein [Chitinophagales bacterium]